MQTFSIIVGLFAIAIGAVYYLGRNSLQKDNLKTDVATGEKTNEVLQKQRDNRIDTVDGADRLFDTIKND